MKNSKKTWGILGTSMGSMLIIVALLTMVGMGSNDTYAAETCSCPEGYSLSADKTKCTKGTILDCAANSASCQNVDKQHCEAVAWGSNEGDVDYSDVLSYLCTYEEKPTGTC